MQTKNILQGAIIAVLVVIAGLLFSISRKMDQQSNATPTQVAQPAQVTPAQPAPAATTPEPPPVKETDPAPTKTQKPSPVAKAKATLPARQAPAPDPKPADATPSPAAASAAAPAAKDPQGIQYTHDASMAPVTSVLPPIPPPPPPPPATKSVTVNAGTPITIRLLNRIDSEKNHTGDTFSGTLDMALISDGVTVAQRGATVQGRLIEDKQSGRVSGVAAVTLVVERVTTVAGDQQVSTENLKREAQSEKGHDAKKVGILTGIGAAIGAMAGGGKGAAIGAGAGAVGGTADVLVTKGKPVRLEPETRLTFRLSSPFTITTTVDGSNAGLNANAQQPSDNSDTRKTDPADRPYLRRRNDN